MNGGPAGMDFMRPLAEEGEDTDSQDGEDSLSSSSPEGYSNPDSVKENDTELADIVDAVAGPGASNGSGGTTSSHKNPVSTKRGGSSRR